jgi:protein-L-isoaspartate(D-aspartate) O-methyltransferase
MSEQYGRFQQQRQQMVEQQLLARGISDEAVLEAMKKVPRHFFLPEQKWAEAYADAAISIGPDQALSQPYIVALMLESVRVTPTDRVLEVGTGTGYQTALLAEIASSVCSVELDPNLAVKAEQLLKGIGYDNVECRSSNGWLGWPDRAPFDVIIVSAAAREIPRDLVKQLKTGGRMILPIGDDDQCLCFIEKTPEGLISQELGAVRFVPLKDERNHH